MDLNRRVAGAEDLRCTMFMFQGQTWAETSVVPWPDTLLVIKPCIGSVLGVYLHFSAIQRVPSLWFADSSLQWLLMRETGSYLVEVYSRLKPKCSQKHTPEHLTTFCGTSLCSTMSRVWQTFQNQTFLACLLNIPSIPPCPHSLFMLQTGDHLQKCHQCSVTASLGST